MMKRRYAVIISSIAAFCIAVVLFSLIRIGPHEVGIVTRNVGLGNTGGVIPADYSPGWHFNIPIVHHWIILPSHIRRVELTKDPRRRSQLGGEALLLQSSDGDRVMLDIDIFFRILPASAHKLVQDSGAGDGHVRVLKALAMDRLRAVFGKMQTEQFYDPKVRYEKSREALKELLSAMKPRFVEVVDIKVLDIEFEPKYERKIKDKKLADQKGELKKAQARVAEQRAVVEIVDIGTAKQVKVIEAKAEADSARIRAEAEKFATITRAEADLYHSQLTAKGDLAVASALAKGRQAKTAALSGKGGANLAALEAVGKLKIDSISFPTSGGDWFDVGEMATRLGAQP